MHLRRRFTAAFKRKIMGLAHKLMAPMCQLLALTRAGRLREATAAIQDALLPENQDRGGPQVAPQPVPVSRFRLPQTRTGVSANTDVDVLEKNDARFITR